MPSLSYCLKTETSCNTQQTTDLSKQSQQTAQGPSRSSLPAGRFDGCFSPTILGIKFDGCFFLAWGFPHLVAPSNQFTVRYIYIYVFIHMYIHHMHTYIYISVIICTHPIYYNPQIFQVLLLGDSPSGVSLPLEVRPCHPSLCPGRRCVARGRDRAWHLSC